MNEDNALNRGKAIQNFKGKACSDEKTLPVTWYCPGRGSNSRPPARRSFKHGQALNHSATEVEVVWACIEKRRICRQESDGGGGAGEKKERKTEAEVDGRYHERLFGERTIREEAQYREKWMRHIRKTNPT